MEVEMQNQNMTDLEPADPFSPRELRLSLGLAVLSVVSAIGIVGLLPLRAFGV
jgi:hypothetical protein